MSKDCAHYEPVAWWFTRKKIGRGLRELYGASEELPATLLGLVQELEATVAEAREPDSTLSA